MNGIRKRAIPQEVFNMQYNGCIKSDEDMRDVENFYNQYEGSDAYKSDIRFVRGNR